MKIEHEIKVLIIIVASTAENIAYNVAYSREGLFFCSPPTPLDKK